jgi:ACS family hexuronate transporter-like MFS transporter
MSASLSGRWVLCWLLFGATALSFLDRQILSVLAPVLTAEFGMSNTDYSRVVFAFQLSYTLMFSIGGRLMDALGTRFGMGLSVFVWSIASGAHALATGAPGLAILRFFLGAGEGSCFPAATKGAVEWFPLEKRAQALGIANGGSAFGAVIAPPLTALLAAHLGWRGAFVATSAMGLLWLAAWFLAFRWLPAHDKGAPATPKAEPASFRKLLADRRLLCVLAARFLFDPVFYFYMFWIPQYLSRERGFSLQQIGSYYWVPFLVLGVSTIVAGRASDGLIRRGWHAHRARRTLLAAAALLTPVSWLASLAPSAEWAIAMMSLLMLAHGFWITNFLGVLSDAFPAGVIATVTGLTGTAGGIGGMLSSLAVGPMVDRFSFAPAFVASGLLYPLALIVLIAGGALAGASARLPETAEPRPTIQGA